MLANDALELLRTDYELYAERCLKIVDEDGELVPLVYRPAQKKLAAEVTRQRKLGLPVRINVLKSRKTGISTAVQGMGIQYATLNPNRECLIIAQDTKTAGKLFAMGDTMNRHLPARIDPRLKPPLAYRTRSIGRAHLHWGIKAALTRGEGDVGINSQLDIDTAEEVEAGRGSTIHFLHASEVAFWRDPLKALGIFNAVPKRPGSVIIAESTARGFNFWKSHFDRAQREEGRFRNIFIGWTEDPQCTATFTDPDERARFIESIGKAATKDLRAVVADEQWLIEKFGATPEQLYWRRLTIADDADGNVDKFRQEYPATAAEAFVGSGRHVFPVKLQRSAIDSAELYDPQGIEGIFMASGHTTRRLPNGTVEVPTGAVWVPREKTGFADDHPWWKLWVPHEGQESLAAPADRQFVEAVDPAGTNATTSGGDPDSWAIQVIDHHSLEQAAVWRGRLDTDQIAEQAFLAYLFFNEALTAVETTGGWGNPLVDDYLSMRYGHKRLYRRQRPLFAKDQSASQSTVLGWSTDRKTKPELVEGFRELLREGTHGVKHMQTALQITTFVWNEKNQAGADVTAHDDLLMAYMIGQQVARLVRPRPVMRPRVSSSVPRTMRRR